MHTFASVAGSPLLSQQVFFGVILKVFIVIGGGIGGGILVHQLLRGLIWHEVVLGAVETVEVQFYGDHVDQPETTDGPVDADYLLNVHVYLLHQKSDAKQT